MRFYKAVWRPISGSTGRFKALEGPIKGSMRVPYLGLFTSGSKVRNQATG